MTGRFIVYLRTDRLLNMLIFGGILHCSSLVVTSMSTCGVKNGICLTDCASSTNKILLCITAIRPFKCITTCREMKKASVNKVKNTILIKKAGLIGLRGRLCSVYPTIKYVNLQENHLTALDDFFWHCREVKILSLIENMLDLNEQRPFKGMQSLYKLYLGNNNIHTISSTVFRGLTKLKSLTLSSNRITVIESDAFRTNRLLDNLYLGFNRIVNITSKHFDTLCKLRWLHIEGNMMNNFHLGCLTRSGEFRNLDVRENRLTRLLMDVDIIPIRNSKNRLEIIIANRNHVSDLGDFLRGISAQYLHTIYVTSNRIQLVRTTDLLQFSKLRILGLAGNKISKFYLGPIPSLGVSRLSHLFLSRNHIKRIYRLLFKRFRYLYKLELDNNFIDSVENGSFAACINLEHLTLANNQLTGLNGSLRGLVKLKTLHINNNRIKSLGAEDFVDLHRVQVLDISRNDIVKLETDTFDQLRSIEHLNIHGNQIKSVEPYSFGVLRQLHTLNLRDNMLCALHNSSISGLPNLQHLIVSHNNLHYISAAVFDMFPNIKEIDLSYNPLTSVPLYRYKSKEQSKINMVATSITQMGLCELCPIRGVSSVEFYEGADNIGRFSVYRSKPYGSVDIEIDLTVSDSTLHAPECGDDSYLINTCTESDDDGLMDLCKAFLETTTFSPFTSASGMSTTTRLADYAPNGSKTSDVDAPNQVVDLPSASTIVYVVCTYAFGAALALCVMLLCLIGGCRWRKKRQVSAFDRMVALSYNRETPRLLTRSDSNSCDK